MAKHLSLVDFEDLEKALNELEKRISEMFQKSFDEECRRQKEEEEKYLTRQEAADKLKISLSALHNRVNKGDIPAYRMGGRTLFKAAEINKSLIRQNH